MRRSGGLLAMFALGVVALGVGRGLTVARADGGGPVVVTGPARPARPAPPKIRAWTFDEGLDAYVAEYGAELAVLTFVPALQRALEHHLHAGRILYGATAFVDVETGRVLALAQISEREPGFPSGLRAVAPAASVFKVVSAAALLRAGVPLSERICTRGGKRRLAPRHLVPNPARDWRCLRFADVIPYSSNAAMARLVDTYVDADALRAEAFGFGFNRPLGGALDVEVSPAHIPRDDPFGVAEAAAGFGEVKLSALHAAAIMAAIARGGVFVPPRAVAFVTGGPFPEAPPPERIIAPWVARALRGMLRDVVTRGTAARKLSPLRAKVALAGKTGSLMDYVNHVDNTWFAGFFPVDAPRVAMATVVVNDWNLWEVKALTVARRSIASYLELERRGLPEEPPAPDALFERASPLGPGALFEPGAPPAP